VTDEMGAVIVALVVKPVIANAVDILAQKRFHIRDRRHGILSLRDRNGCNY
jgi:hypothetical protein